MIINGNLIAQRVKEEVKCEIKHLKSLGITPGLAVIIVGTNPASEIYVKNKQKACESLGIYSKKISLPENISESDLLRIIDELNVNKNIHGILAQLPLPPHINEQHVAERIHPDKDVDAFSYVNIGKLITGNACLIPCTPSGIMELLKHENVLIKGKHCVVVGRSNIVGKPIAALMLQSNATVTVCHSQTKNLVEFCKSADILICAVGKPNFICKEMIKEGAVIIDVGINRNENGPMCGDVDFDSVQNLASLITPVPGGVGPMTIAMLMKNTVIASKIQNKCFLN